MEEARAEAARREAVALEQAARCRGDTGRCTGDTREVGLEQARAHVETARLAAAAEEASLKERLARVERRAATELDAAEQARDPPISPLCLPISPYSSLYLPVSPISPPSRRACRPWRP